MNTLFKYTISKGLPYPTSVCPPTLVIGREPCLCHAAVRSMAGGESTEAFCPCHALGSRPTRPQDARLFWKDPNQSFLVFLWLTFFYSPLFNYLHFYVISNWFIYWIFFYATLLELALGHGKTGYKPDKLNKINQYLSFRSIGAAFYWIRPSVFLD